MTAENLSSAGSNTASSAPVLEVDVAIVGGAMAGATLALGLAALGERLKRPLKIALIEANRPGSTSANPLHPGFDARSIAIAHGSVFELTRLGIWPKLAHLGSAIDNIHVSDRGHFGMTELNASQFQLSSLGQVVELERIGHSLFELLDAADIHLFCPNKLASVSAQNDGHQLTLAGGEVLFSRLLVAADGVNSVVRETFAQPLEQVDFGQTAIVANVLTDKAHNHWAWERFTNSGPLALLPMSLPTHAQLAASGAQQAKARLSLVWALDAGSAAMMKDADDATFLSSLQEAFGFRAGQFIAVSQRHTYPLTLSYMPRPIYHRCVFVGNAAQTLHPIAGQGFNLGLRDIVCLIEAVGEALTNDEDIGASAVIHRYLHSREQDRNRTLGHIEFLVRGFSNDYWPLVAGRSLGLRLLSWVPPLKTPVAYRAMGFR